MNEPLVTVVMPAYNAEKYIAKSIESVINQTYKNLEVIIVNDCSKDNTAQIIQKYCKQDSRIRSYTNEVNSGVSYTRNFAIENAKGSYIAFLDSDDIWKEEKLQKQVNLLLEKEPILIYTGSSFIDENDNPYNYTMKVPETVNYRRLLKQNIISCSSVLIKKEVLQSTKMEHDKLHEDFLVWLKILKSYNKENIAIGINEPLLIYRISKNSKSGNKVKAAKMTYMVYKHMKLNIFQRIYYMCQYMIRSVIKYKRINRSLSKNDI